MTTIESAEATCRTCGETKNLSEFYACRRHLANPQCSACERDYQRKAQQRRRESMGDEAWLALNRDIVNRSRKRSKNKKGREYGRAKRRALRQLAELHPTEYDHLLAVALREIRS